VVGERIFGTDGIRGQFGGKYVCEDFFRKIGEAIGALAASRHWRRILVGDDGRRSAGILRAALLSGLPDDLEVLSVGTLSTPAIAFSAKKFSADVALALTASHNCAADNGVKFFSGQGWKWTRGDEVALECAIGERLSPSGGRRSAVADISAEAVAAYGDHFLSLLPSNALAGKLMVLDGANGAAAWLAQKLYVALGATVEQLGNDPNGLNINENCGSEHPELLCERVKNCGAHWGVAVDGDGDRAVICDSSGAVVPGELIMAPIAVHLGADTLVTTVLSNGALEAHLEKFSIAVRRTDVGDRNVAEDMKRCGSAFGGEPSGHFIWMAAGPVADGLLAAALFFAATADGCRWRFPLNGSAAGSVAVRRPIPLGDATHLSAALARARAALGGSGRAIVRYSGTESKLRLSVEAKTSQDAEMWLNELCSAFGADVAANGQ
jgi:phosphoglucosamine mutase